MSRNLLAISAGLNLVLLVFFLLRPGTEAAKSVVSTGLEPPPIRQIIAKTRTNYSVAQTIAPNFHFNWSEIESEDYATYIANLRGIGCPERTIEHIILNDIEKLYEEKKRALTTEKSQANFWTTGHRLQSEKKIELALEREKIDVIKSLLGRDLCLEARKAWVEEDEIAFLFGFLPEEKIEPALTVGIKLGKPLFDTFDDVNFPEEEPVRLAMYEELKAALAALGTPAEFEEAVARSLTILGKPNWKNVDLTATEARQMALLLFQFADPFRDLILMENFWQQQRSLPPDLFNEARMLLGETRFEDFLCAVDNEIGAFREAAEKSGLSPGIALEIQKIKTASLTEGEKIRQNETLSRAQKRAELKILQEASGNAISQLVGENTTNTTLKAESFSWWKALKNP
jgi:hypothetical protein